MHAIIRRYDGMDQSHTTELVSKVNAALVPKLQKLPGFKGYYLIDAGNGSSARSVSSRHVGRARSRRRSSLAATAS